jgi:hypothetical protein
MNLYVTEFYAQDHQQTMLNEAEQSRLAHIAASGKRPTRKLSLKRIRQIFTPTIVSDEPRVIHRHSTPISNRG